MDCANLMKALRMWIYCASVAAKLSIHGFRSPLILVEVIDRNGSEELLNPSGQKQLHVTNFTPTLKAVKNFSNSHAARTVVFVASWTATFRNYTLLNFWHILHYLISINIPSDVMTRPFIRSSLIHWKLWFHVVKEKIKWRRRKYKPIRSQVLWKDVGV